MRAAVIWSMGILIMGCRSEESIKVFNSLPVAEITSHSDGHTFVEGDSVSFIATISDSNHAEDELLVTWYSGTDVICSESTVPADGIVQCQVGIQADWEDIRVQAIDPAGGAGSDNILIDVQVNATPVVQVLGPTENGLYYSDQLITFSGISTDAEDDPDQLVSTWDSSLDGALQIDATPNSNGEFSGSGYLTAGDHFITLSTEDTNGRIGTDTVTITVGPPNSEPLCDIVSPQDGSAGPESESVRFEGSASDVDIPSNELSVEWSSDKDGLIGTSTPNSSGEVAFVYDSLSVNTHTITMTVTDEVGASCSDFVVYTVGTPPELVMTSPLDGSLFNQGEAVTFRAEVTDNEDLPPEIVLEWESNIDGLISTQGPSSSGVAQFVSTILSSGVHTMTVTARDTDGLFSDAVFVITINALPTAPFVSLNPDPAYTDDDLVATASGSTDGDGQTVSYAYNWLKNNVAQGVSSSILSNALTNRGEIWTVQVTPNDGITDGPYTEQSVTISNSPPTVLSVSVSPIAPSTLDTLTCTATSSDLDGDPVSLSYAWYKGGQLQSSTSSTISGPFQQSDVLTCRVTPDDGFDVGTYSEASVTIANTPPVVNSVSVSPSILYTDSIATATVSAIDPDGDALAYTFDWIVNDGSGAQLVQSNTTASLTDTLDGVSFFDRDDDVYVTVSANDASTSTSLDSVTMVVANTPPSAFNPLVSPTNPVAGQDDILCTVQTSDADVDAVTVAYSWTVDGVLTTNTTDTVFATDIADGEVWTCSATPNDGLEDGATVSAVAVVGADNAEAVGSNLCAAAGQTSNTAFVLTACLSDESIVTGESSNSSYTMQLGSIYRVQPSN